MAESLFTPEEQEIVALYQDPKRSGIGRATRLSVQYAVVTGVFTYLAIAWRDPWYAGLTYAVFVGFMLIRLLKARRLAGVMPRVLEKYRQRVAQLETQLLAHSSHGS